MDATNLARSLQGWVRVRPGGRASRGDCARLCALYGPHNAVAFWRAAMAQAWYVRTYVCTYVHDCTSWRGHLPDVVAYTYART